MKSLVDYILESEEVVWVVKDKDLDGAIMDVCTTEEDAKKMYDEHMKENKDNHLEITSMKRSEVEKNN